MKAHTPAPWRVKGTNSGLFIAGGKPGYLAEIRDCGSGDVAANALLIAAAPDLLEALRWALDQLDDDLNPDHAAALAAAHAALAKATA